MRSTFIILLLFLFSACAKKISLEDLTHLNGYWEIDTVTFQDGSTKEYKVNTSVDYIEVNDLKGFRKKMQPKFDGSFTTSNNAEFFTILETNGVYKMYYKTNLSDWTEQLIAISETNFLVRNEENVTYNYRRFQPINIKE